MAPVATAQERVDRCARNADGTPNSDTGEFSSIDAAPYLARGQAQLPRGLINLVRVGLGRVFVHSASALATTRWAIASANWSSNAPKMS